MCVDGPAGSGKTTLAAALAALHPDSAVVHVDDLLDGWDGLPRVTEQMATILDPLAVGRPGRYRRYDWLAGAFAETVVVEPTSLLVLEGVGSGDRRPAARATVLAWVEVAAELRLARGMSRDGEAMRDHWERWMLEEQRHFVDQDTRARADVVV